MINSKQDLNYYLCKDNCGWGSKSSLYRWIKRLGGSENYFSNDFFRILRHYEYHLNKKSNRLILRYWEFRYNHFRIRSNMFVAPNVFGPGVQIIHPGFLRADAWVHIGSNCTVLPNVIFGKKKSMESSNSTEIFVGNDCYISTGAIILGPVRIGNNVIVGAGALVNKDIPDNAVVAGVPAKIISTRYKE